MKRAAFTVWELLAVIVIVLLVIVVLWPVFQSARQPSPYRSCASNEKQIGLDILMYAQDNDRVLPNIAAPHDSKNTWRVALAPYAKGDGVFQCPARQDKSLGPDGVPHSYAANYTGNYSGRKTDVGDGAFGGPDSHGVKIDDIRRPESLIMLCEVTHHSAPDFNIDNLAAFDPGNTYLYAGHTDGSNYLLCDGHVKFFPSMKTKDLWHRDKDIPLSPAAVQILENARRGRAE